MKCYFEHNLPNFLVHGEHGNAVLSQWLSVSKFLSENIDQKSSKFTSTIASLDFHLGCGKYIAGENITLCDAALYVPLRSASIELSTYSNILRWLNALAFDVEEKSSKKSKKNAEANEVVKSNTIVNLDADSDPSKLDFRVGVVVKCWEHPEAEKLLCEEIDLGEANVRTIASGLKAHYNASDMVGRRVIVLANLKDRTMVGFKSQVQNGRYY